MRATGLKKKPGKLEKMCAEMLESVQVALLQHQKEMESRQVPSGSIENSVFGKLERIRDEGLVTYRRYPYLNEFWSKRRAKNGKPFYNLLGKRDRTLVDDWQNSIPKIMSRLSGPLRESLAASGVYDLRVEVADDGLPTQAQEEAYRRFVRAEKQLCTKMVTALVRFYQFVREQSPRAFDWIKDIELPDKPNSRQLSRLLVGFGGMQVCRASAAGVSPLIFRWNPIWDEEHGLSVVMFDGEVVLMGPEAEETMYRFKSGKMPRVVSYEWGVKQMNKAEIKALRTLVSNFRKASG
jgi:hypothetical protein